MSREVMSMKRRWFAMVPAASFLLLLIGCGGSSSTGVPLSTDYTIGGTVSGLAGSGLVLQDNGGNNLSITTNGNFTFSTQIASGSAYDVSVLTQPSSPLQACTVTDGTGTASADVTGIQITCTTNQSSLCNSVAPITIGSTTYTPEFCQEFTGIAAPPDMTVWTFDLGNNGGWGNNEQEVYCGPPGYANNPPQCPTTFSTSTNTVYVDGNGHLVIQPINDSGTWLSTRMKTEGLENFQYGIVEASLQLPDTTDQGLWPAFWSLGSDFPSTPWPDCGEADFMENWSPQIDSGPGPNGNRSTIHTTLSGGDGIGQDYTFPSGEQADTAFHTYGVVWSANLMQFFVDDPSSPFFVVTPSDLQAGDTWPFNADIFLIMNVAIGGTLGGSTSGLTNPQPLIADYVRWYAPPSAQAAKKRNLVLGTPAGMTMNHGATASVELTPEVAPGTGLVYFTCSTDAPGAACGISTRNRLNRHVVDSKKAESVTVSVTTSAKDTPRGSYTATVYAFAQGNRGDGSSKSADAAATIPFSVAEEEVSGPPLPPSSAPDAP